jgi:hypothetical protein
MVDEKKQVNCESCKQKATYKCRMCDDVICEECKIKHCCFVDAMEAKKEKLLGETYNKLGSLFEPICFNCGKDNISLATFKTGWFCRPCIIELRAKNNGNLL